MTSAERVRLGQLSLKIGSLTNFMFQVCSTSFKCVCYLKLWCLCFNFVIISSIFIFRVVFEPVANIAGGYYPVDNIISLSQLLPPLTCLYFFVASVRTWWAQGRQKRSCLPSSSGLAVGRCYFINMSGLYIIQSNILYVLFSFFTVYYILFV